MRFFLYIIVFLISLINTSLAQGKYNWATAKEINLQIISHAKSLNSDSTIYYLDELINFYKANKDQNHTIEASARKIGYLISFNELTEAFQLALSIYDEYCEGFKAIENCSSCQYTYTHLSKIMIIMQDYNKGIEYLNMMCEEQRDPLFYHHKANLYCLLGLPDSALITSQKGIALVEKSDDLKEIAASYNNHGLIAKKLKEYNIAISAFTKAIKIRENTEKSIVSYSYIFGNLGSCYYEIKSYKKATEYLLIDSKGSVNYEEKDSYINAELLLAKIAGIKEEHQNQIERLNNLLNNYSKHLSVSHKLYVLEMLTDAHKKLNNKKSYNHYSNEFVALNKVHFQNQIKTYRNLTKQYTIYALEQISQKIDLERQLIEQTIMVQQKENERKQLKSWLLIGLLVSMILVGFLLFLRFKAVQSKKANIKEADLKLAIKEQEVLALRIKEENRNVQALSLELMMKKDFSSNLVKELDQLKSVSKSEMKNIEIFIQNELDVKSTRAHLQSQMGDLSSNFYAELKISHSNLTEAELRLAAMVVMKIPNKEIAISKNVTLESAKKSKNRLKKKLNVIVTDDLTTYLQQFLSPNNEC